VFIYENQTMRPVDDVLRSKGGRQKEKDGKGESNPDIL
jgi:hypothetical protein